MLGYILLLSICQNLENRHLRLGTNRMHVRLMVMVTIPTMIRSSQGTDERSRMYSFGMVSGRLPSSSFSPFLALYFSCRYIQKTKDKRLAGEQARDHHTFFPRAPRLRTPLAAAAAISSSSSFFFSFILASFLSCKH